MPKLSPTQIDSSTTKLVRWHVEVGDVVPAYSLLCELETNSLTEDSSSLPERLDIEIQEESVVVNLLCLEGDEAKPGVPIALLCEDEDDIEEAANISLDMGGDVYADPNLRMVGFQAYVKSTSPSCG